MHGVEQRTCVWWFGDGVVESFMVSIGVPGFGGGCEVRR